MGQIFLVLFTVVLLIFCGGCESTGGDGGASNSTISIMSWNLQALFDGTEHGGEYDEYRDSTGWSGEKYSARLNNIAKGIEHLEQGAPDVLALVEVENAQVLEDLARTLAKYGYKWTFFANNPGMSLGVGVLSKFPLISTRSHSFSGKDEMTPRPVMEVWVQPKDAPLALFICHWKSKLGGDEATESLRRASARVILRRLREIGREQPGTPALVMGDLNENHDEFYRQGGNFLSALIPDDPQAAALTGFTSDEGAKQRDFLILSENKPPVSAHFGPEAMALYSPWYNELADGSYYYKKAWETIDHFLLNEALFDGTGWDFKDCSVVTVQPFTNSKGFPASYNPRTGMGLSDHLPLLLMLKMQESTIGAL
ncbi:endonuclease [Spirochaetia bacterium]|nr:endonuclease [Spirochaetia bacterium]